MRSRIRTCLMMLCLLSAGNGAAGEITVFAAASLTDALKETGAAYEKSTGEKVHFNFAASNTLAMQITAGAPADLFFSADEAKMDALEKLNLIVKTTRKDLLGNSLVVITPERGLKISEPGDLTKSAIRHLSIGDPKAVPAGIYAKAWLKKAELWKPLQPKIVPAENVRAAMAVVESGNAEVGIVYKTDAAISKKVQIALEIPPADGPKITYPATLLTDSRNQEAARKFLTYLASKDAAEIFVKFGFTVLD
jgi:molybdate transport system substrate-binding protein